MKLSNDALEILKSSQSHYWGKWDIDWQDAIALDDSVGDYFTPEARLYMSYRARGVPHNETRRLLGISSSVLLRLQQEIFWKYHYALYVSHMLGGSHEETSGE